MNKNILGLILLATVLACTSLAFLMLWRFDTPEESEPEPGPEPAENTTCRDSFPNCQTCAIQKQYSDQLTYICQTCSSGFYKLNGCFKICQQNNTSISYNNWSITCEDSNSNLSPESDQTYECKFTTQNHTCYDIPSEEFNGSDGYYDNYSTGTVLDFRSQQIHTTLIAYSKYAFDGADKKKVTRINLAENAISELTEYAFSGFTSVTSLVLYLNKVQFISENSFYGLDTLKILYLYKNEIQSLEGNPFKHLVNLDSLPLYLNQIYLIETTVFQPLKQLTYLQLAENALGSLYFNQTLEDETFDSLGKLRALAMEKNQLNFIQSRLFQNLYSIEAIDISGNNCTMSDYACGFRKSNYETLKDCSCQ